MVEVSSCRPDDGAWIAEGTITNLEADRRSYILTVEFVRPGTDNVWTRVRVEVDEVDPGASTEFGVRRQVGLDEVECVVGEVDGPAPFGLDIGR